MRRQHLRPSQIITTFGPGSVVDLPDDSVMIAGTEHWFDVNKPQRKIMEPRLQAALKVAEFRSPPVGSFIHKDVPFVRFPRWRVCPRCNRLSDQFRWPRGDPELPPVPRCDKCDSVTYPARIVVACPKGHIDDFPWYRWVHRGANCGGGNLLLRGEGRSAALGDLRVECSCGRSMSLSGALGGDAMSAARCSCRGRRPWLDDEREQCGEKLYSLQRGASNIYFSVVRSALSIPPWSDPLQAEVATFWAQFPTPPPREHWPLYVKDRFPGELPERVYQCIERLCGLRTSRPSIRSEEYQALEAEETEPSVYFEARHQDMSTTTSRFLARLVALPRLREIRVLIGFTRIQPSEMDPAAETMVDQEDLKVATAPLSARPLPWLPAVENLGEGVFVKLHPERLKAWETNQAVVRRSAIVTTAYARWRQGRGLKLEQSWRPRLVLLHTLAHLLIRQMALESGYSSASLRERIYSDETMAGLLIYTSSPDSDGSLGGLVRQASAPEGFDGLLLSTTELARICSSDPLCREHDPARTERLNGAACHACAMVSETSCEFGNRLLDRRLVVSLPTGERTGYFDFDA
jgi:hypothetical protein